MVPLHTTYKKHWLKSSNPPQHPHNTNPPSGKDTEDILEKIKSGHTPQLTDQLNNMDSTGNIKFTQEEETNRTINFLDIKIHHKDDGSIKITVYRKPTHTGQYLLWTSEQHTNSP